MLRPSPNHGKLRPPNDDDDDDAANKSRPRAKTINVFRACLGAQLTICAQK